jgi:hypothetical protein
MGNVIAVGLILEVLGDRHGIEPILVGFPNPYRGPDVSVREDAVCVGVHRQHQTAILQWREA